MDFVIEKRRHGIARQEALLQAGKERSRPIIMTTLAMVAGMVPAVFADGSGDGFRAVMAITVISGLIASTLLSLVFVLVVYMLMDDLCGWLAPKLKQLTNVTHGRRHQHRSDRGHGADHERLQHPAREIGAEQRGVVLRRDRAE